MKDYIKRIIIVSLTIISSLFIHSENIFAETLQESIKITMTTGKLTDETAKVRITVQNVSNETVEKAAIYFVLSPSEQSYINTKINNVEYKWSITSDDNERNYLAFLKMEPNDTETVEKVIPYKEGQEVTLKYVITDKLITENPDDFSLFSEHIDNINTTDYLSNGDVVFSEEVLPEKVEDWTEKDPGSTEAIEEDNQSNSSSTSNNSSDESTTTNSENTTEEKQSISIIEKIKTVDKKYIIIGIIAAIAIVLISTIIIIYKR